MARIRSAKPEWWSKVKWCALPRDVRFTYKGIWEVMADDEGRFQAEPRLIKSSVWPLDDDITTKKLEKWLARLASVTVTTKDGDRAPALLLYVVDGVRYGFMPGFVKHQKISHATPSKLPPPPEILGSGSGKAPETLRPDVDVDVDVDLERDVDRKTATTARARAESPDEFCRQLITAANQGMAENPAIGDAFNPIVFGHGASYQAATDILAAGVDADFAASVVFETARTMRPAGRNRQITSLGYCTARVIEQWESHEALSAANGTPRPAGRTRTSSRRAARVSVAEEGYANAKLALQDYPE